MPKRIVDRVEPGADRTQILCTTYQMRNFYGQFHDGFFTVLDVMNYMQHHAVVRLIKDGNRVLDICCGRGLLLPMLRYYRHIRSYTGIDIQKSNAVFRTKKVTDGKPLPMDYYPFPVYFVEGNVSEMDLLLPADAYDFLVYTSSLEHMNPDDGLKSLHAARKVAKRDATLFLTCPNTPEGQDGYDTQYAAHVYEWKQSEVREGLKASGWALEEVFGLLIDVRSLKSVMSPEALAMYEQQRKLLPNEWLNTAYAALYPNQAKELAYIARAI